MAVAGLYPKEDERDEAKAEQVDLRLLEESSRLMNLLVYKGKPTVPPWLEVVAEYQTKRRSL